MWGDFSVLHTLNMNKVIVFGLLVLVTVSIAAPQGN